MGTFWLLEIGEGGSYFLRAWHSRMYVQALVSIHWIPPHTHLNLPATSGA
jgi:hypothetical protein